MNILINKNFSFLSSPLAALYSGIPILKNIVTGATLFIEEWKDVAGFEGLYQVSSTGRVKSLARRKYSSIYLKGYCEIIQRILVPIIDSNGYLYVNLHKDKTRHVKHIHHLMADAFLGGKPKSRQMVIDHKNNVRNDNRLENLQIISFRLNTSKDKIRTKNLPTGVSKRGNSWVAGIFINGKNIHLGTSKTIEGAAKLYTDKSNQLLKNINYA